MHLARLAAIVLVLGTVALPNLEEAHLFGLAAVRLEHAHEAGQNVATDARRALDDGIHDRDVLGLQES